MSNIKDLEKSLPDMSHRFEVDLKGQLTNLGYKGEFVCKIPSAKDQSAIAKHKAYLNGGFEDGLDVGTRNLHHMISYLRYTLKEFPKWWEDNDLGYELYDVNVIETVYGYVLEFEQNWMKKVWGEVAEEVESESEETEG